MCSSFNASTIRTYKGVRSDHLRVRMVEIGIIFYPIHMKPPWYFHVMGTQKAFIHRPQPAS